MAWMQPKHVMFACEGEIAAPAEGFQIGTRRCLGGTMGRRIALAGLAGFLAAPVFVIEPAAADVLFTCSSVSGATMPKPSVPLCKAKPMTNIRASPTLPAAAELPMASPSAKLCSPIPTAIMIANRLAESCHSGVLHSCTVAAPGPPTGAPR